MGKQKQLIFKIKGAIRFTINEVQDCKVTPNILLENNEESLKSILWKVNWLCSTLAWLGTCIWAISELIPKCFCCYNYTFPFHSGNNIANFYGLANTFKPFSLSYTLFSITLSSLELPKLGISEWTWHQYPLHHSEKSIYF